MAKKWGCLLINLGTPVSPKPADVGRYLTEFLLDPEVIDIPWIARQILVRALIVPRRSKQSGLLYEKIWSKSHGSPLFFHTERLALDTQKLLPEVKIVYGFRYGRPNLATALDELQEGGVTDLIVLPLYPQYATSATRTSKTKLEELGIGRRFASWKFVDSFHLDDFYIRSQVELIRQHLIADSHVLFTFHSLPIRQISNNHAGCGECLKNVCCTKQGDSLCYKRQCYETAEKLAAELHLISGQWSISFQSKLGRAEWLTPATDRVLADLPKRGIKSLTAVNAGFTADCLETLEEMDHQGKEIFLTSGGQKWARVPCLNTFPPWVENLSRYLKTQTPEEKNGKTPSQPSL